MWFCFKITGRLIAAPTGADFKFQFIWVTREGYLVSCILYNHCIWFVWSWDRDNEHHSEIWAPPAAEAPRGHRYGTWWAGWLQKRYWKKTRSVFHLLALRELCKSLFEQLNVFRFNEGMVLGHLYIIQEDDRQEWNTVENNKSNKAASGFHGRSCVAGTPSMNWPGAA